MGQVRLHAYHSERILAGSERLAPLIPLVGMHHERLDGSGCTRTDLPMPSRVLAARTDREVEVLRLVADGCQIAQRLVISRRTAERHVRHIYRKISGSSRAAAALFAMEHDLLSARYR